MHLMHQCEGAQPGVYPSLPPVRVTRRSHTSERERLYDDMKSNSLPVIPGLGNHKATSGAAPYWIRCFLAHTGAVSTGEDVHAAQFLAAAAEPAEIALAPSLPGREAARPP